MIPTKTIGIIGGGIAGLTAAWQLQKRLLGVRIEVLEASDRVGGMLHTERTDGYLIETSADMFTTDPPAALELCETLGRSSELIQTQPVRQRAFIATPTGICPVPQGFSLMLPNDLQSVIDSSLLDEEGKQRFLQEEHVPPKSDSADESLESFVVRRYGQQVFERLIHPLVSGIYTADPKRLSMLATMERFVDMERQHGSLIKSVKAKYLAAPLSLAEEKASGARYDLFRAPTAGMGQLVKWILQELKQVRVRTATQVQRVLRRGSSWEVGLNRSEAQSFDGLIVTTPTNVAGRLLRQLDPRVADLLSSIDSASCAVVVLGFDESQLRENFRGYGIVVPAYLNRQLIAASFSSNKFAGRAPDGKVLIRCFIGGALQGELVELPDDELTSIAIQELDRLVGIDGQPELHRVYRWNAAMPQYHVGHLDRVSQVDQQMERHAGLELAGNGYAGVGIPACIESGMSAANRLMEYLAQRDT